MQRGNYNWDNTNEDVEEIRRRMQRSNISRNNNTSNTSSSNRTSTNNESISNTTNTRMNLPILAMLGIEITSTVPTTTTTTTTTTHYCNASYCYQTVSCSGDYCNQHQKYCQESSCYNRISSYENYCSDHKSNSYQTSSYSTYSTPTYYSTPSTRYCEASGCCSSISYSESYCYNHRNTCSAYSCYTRIGPSESYCSSHQTNYCSYCSAQISRNQTYCYSHLNSCRDCSARISSGQTYCSSHQNSYCASCSTQIPRGQSYCYSHANGCYSCGQRISQGQSYCYQHANQCSHCSTRISSGQSLCSNHQNRSCLSCGTTIPYSNTYCHNHRNACRECSQRVPIEQNYCHSHLISCRVCSTRIPEKQNYCSDHVLRKCQESNCSSQVNAPQSYCLAHRGCCKEATCKARIPIPGHSFGSMWLAGTFFRNQPQGPLADKEYCISHQNACEDSSCSKRISSKQKYCSLHNKIDKLLNKISSSELKTRETCQNYQKQLDKTKKKAVPNPKAEKAQKKLTDYLNSFTDLEELLKVIQEATNPEELNETLIWYNSWVELTKKSKAKKNAFKALYEPIGEVLEQAKKKSEEWENAEKKHKCQESSCEKQILLTKDYCAEHIIECQKVTCSTRIPGNQTYCSLHKKQTIQKWWEEGKITDEQKKILLACDIEGEYELETLIRLPSRIEEIYKEKIVESPTIPCCDLRLELSGIPPKNLHYWWRARKVTDKQKKDLENIGMDGSPYSADEYLLEELKKIIVCEEIARTSGISDSFRNEKVKSIVFFSPKFNPNCALIISKDSNSDLFEACFILYEAPWERTGNNLFVKTADCWYSDLDKSHEKISQIVAGLNGENPILAISNKYLFGIGKIFLGYELIGVREENLSSNAENSPQGYLKPFDIVGVRERKADMFAFDHAFIYLGKEGNTHKIAQVTKANNKAEITNWEETYTDKNEGFFKYYALVPYKNPERIKEHIARAVSSKEYQNHYNLWRDNCQHFANRCVLGLDLASGESGKLLKQTPQFKLINELREELHKTDNRFADLTIENSQSLGDNQKKVNEYVAQIVHNPSGIWGYKLNRIVEIKPIDGCKIQ